MCGSFVCSPSNYTNGDHDTCDAFGIWIRYTTVEILLTPRCQQQQGRNCTPWKSQFAAWHSQATSTADPNHYDSKRRVPTGQVFRLRFYQESFGYKMFTNFWERLTLRNRRL